MAQRRGRITAEKREDLLTTLLDMGIAADVHSPIRRRLRCILGRRWRLWSWEGFKRVGVVDTEWSEMPPVPGQEQEFMNRGRGGDGRICEAGVSACCRCGVRQGAGGASDLRIQRKDSVAVIQHKA